jgi:hypothetical protein
VVALLLAAAACGRSPDPAPGPGPAATGAAPTAAATARAAPPSLPVAAPLGPSLKPGTRSAPPASPTRPAPPAPATGGCPVFPADNVWHARVDRLPVLAGSAALVAAIGASAHLHPDFGAGLIDGQPFGIPVTDVPAGTPGVRVGFDYADESDPGPYPIPAKVRVEGGPTADGDRHVILRDSARCRAYELFDASGSGASWHAGSGAVWDLRSNALRPAGWTSADAAGLPVLAGLVRYDEVAAGRIDHAIRVTVPTSADRYRWDCGCGSRRRCPSPACPRRRA